MGSIAVARAERDSEGSMFGVIARGGAVFLRLSSVEDRAVDRGRFSGDTREGVGKGGNENAA